AHAIRKNAEMTAVEITRDQLWLSILVSRGIDTIAIFPEAIVLIADLPVAGAAMVIAHPIRCQMCGRRDGISAGAIARIAVVDGDEALAAGGFEHGIVVIERRNPLRGGPPIVEVCGYLFATCVGEEIRDIGGPLAGATVPEISVAGAAAGPAEDVGV